MKLQTGKQYRTRNGLVTPPLEPAKNGTNYRFSAKIQEPEWSNPSVCAWLEDGRFLNPKTDHRLDIVEEI